ncbi:response regulator transcription factor [Lacibacter sp. MH-610]|uniref:response regulator n=1 Tax=Lacibacter sp. MH-610 TaxID=3020883 RepID=UPI003891C023
MNKIKLALIDDQQLFRQGLASLIADTNDLELLYEAETASQLLTYLKQNTQLPDILLLDMKLPDMNGNDLNKTIQKEYPSIKVLVLSMYDQERLVYRMIEAGASGYLAKNCNKEELLTAIFTVHRSGFYFNMHTMQAMRNAAKFKNQPIHNVNNIPVELTKREEEILKLICREYTNAEIAKELYVSLRTVDGHRNNLLQKTGCKNTAGLVIFAVRFGIYEVTI